MIPSLRHLDMDRRLMHLAHLGFDPRVIYDVGAAHGDWTRMAASIWPRARIFGFEPNRSEEENLNATSRDFPQFTFRRCFLGPQAKTVRYTPRGTQTSLAEREIPSGESDVAEMCSIDPLIAAGELTPPDFMKLDVQGFELEVLSGAQQALRHAQGVLLEVSLYDSDAGIPTADAVIAYLLERDFVWYDIAGAIRRPVDDALWQMDLLFLQRDHPLRMVKTYR